MKIENQLPPQPEESAWRFVEELQAPLWTHHNWAPRAPRENEADLSRGVTVTSSFPDEARVLATAFDDLETFLRAGDVSTDGDYEIEICERAMEVAESYVLEIGADKTAIFAADSEGVRRAIFQLEDEMLRAGGPFLPRGKIEKTPVIRTRISRCFFGPINRPPKKRDELADDVNYYPDQYLNRLAHDGINGLWLTIRFRDICPSHLFPEYGKDAARRLNKLRETVNRCARYGIKIYVFFIEPMAFGLVEEYQKPLALLEKNPDLAGHTVAGQSLVYFCANSPTGQRYLEESFFFLFSEVPNLGGAIGINLGERPTHCYSDVNYLENNNCPRCSKLGPAQAFSQMLAAMSRGIKRANPAAELISWLYVPEITESPNVDPDFVRNAMREIAAQAPPEVILQVNFESNAKAERFGKTHRMRDYSLAFVGPSEVFADCARAASTHGVRASAKLQVGCSHEVATVPFVPVPGNIYRKYAGMHQLGVSSAMQCWYFGNYPSPMTKAAGLLSFAPLPENEDEFLHQLAALHWGEDRKIVVEAWKKFRDSYAQFPVPLAFSWFGPVHDCIAWPLHLFPVDEPIQPSWLLKEKLSGDRIGECFAFGYTLDETLETCRAMSQKWNEGVKLLEEIASRYAGDAERVQEIGVARALGLQLRSAWNVLQFYALREELPFADREACRAHLSGMETIIREETDNARVLAALCENDSRLGFHAEAEGYKYFPAKLEWRARQLENLLRDDFPRVRKSFENGENPFAEYAGLQPQGAQYRMPRGGETGESDSDWENAPSETCRVVDTIDADLWRTMWQARADEKALHFRVTCQVPDGENAREYSQAGDAVQLLIEPRRLWPVQSFRVARDGGGWREELSTAPNAPWNYQAKETPDGWEACLTIPFEGLLDGTPPGRPLRVQVERIVNGYGTLRWIERDPLPSRLIFVDHNSRDLGWLLAPESAA